MKDNTILEWIKEHKKQIALWSGIILIAVPLIVYGLSEISLLPVTGGNDWAGFWGGYIGAIIGGLITLFVMQYTIKSENEKSKRQEKVQYFNDIIKLSAEFFECIGNLYVKISKYMTSKSNENLEQILQENNRGARISIILELMLETRKSQYDLSDYVQEATNLMDRVNILMEHFYNLLDESFSDEEKNKEFNLELDKLVQMINSIKNDFEDIVKRNLYDI